MVSLCLSLPANGWNPSLSVSDNDRFPNYLGEEPVWVSVHRRQLSGWSWNVILHRTVSFNITTAGPPLSRPIVWLNVSHNSPVTSSVSTNTPQIGLLINQSLKMISFCNKLTSAFDSVPYIYVHWLHCLYVSFKFIACKFLYKLHFLVVIYPVFCETQFPYI